MGKPWSMLMAMLVILTLVINSFEVKLASAKMSERACKEERRICVNACKSILYGKVPSPKYCERIRLTHIECVCGVITPKLAALIDIKYAIRVVEGCGRRVPRNYKCGSKLNLSLFYSCGVWIGLFTSQLISRNICRLSSAIFIRTILRTPNMSRVQQECETRMNLSCYTESSVDIEDRVVRPMIHRGTHHTANMSLVQQECATRMNLSCYTKFPGGHRGPSGKAMIHRGTYHTANMSLVQQDHQGPSGKAMIHRGTYYTANMSLVQQECATRMNLSCYTEFPCGHRGPSGKAMIHWGT
ncbi:hypothetical protein BC332_20275 [Capsicum chinense]|nr:hypothetical protein BC332_20275 [Capsicum chinense]